MAKQKKVNKAAQALGRLRMKKMTKAQLTAFQKKAIEARWRLWRERQAASENATEKSA